MRLLSRDCWYIKKAAKPATAGSTPASATSVNSFRIYDYLLRLILDCTIREARTVFYQQTIKSNIYEKGISCDPAIRRFYPRDIRKLHICAQRFRINNVLHIGI